MNNFGRKFSSILCSLVLGVAAVAPAQAADVVLINLDPPGLGLDEGREPVAALSEAR